MDENTLSMAEKMNQLYQEREEQYKKREKLFDDRSKQLQSLANALEKQKNSQEQKATDLDNREKELDQIQDALAAKVEDMEKQETALKNWEQETKESLAKAKQEQENELIKKRQELQMEKLQAQNLSIELQAERDNLKMMQENLKLYPDMSLPTDKETELQAKIETLQSRLSMAEKERDSKTEQMEKLQKDFDAKEAELANLQLKAEDSSTDPEVEEKLRKRNGELQGKVIELNKQVKSLQRDLDDQAKDKEELQRQLEENSNQPESHDLSAEELQNYLLTLLSADPNVKNYSFTVVGKEIYYRENSVMRPVDVSATAKERIKGMIGIRDCTRALINLQLNEYSDADIKQKQEELSALYDGYTAKFGILNSRANRIAFDQDSSYSLICSLENLDEEGNFKEKAAIFQKRTIKQEKVVTSFRISKKDIHLILRRQTFLRKNIQSFLTVEFHLNFTEAAQIY